VTTIKIYFRKTWDKLAELYGSSINFFMALILVIVATLCIALFTFFNSAAPTTLTIAAGEKGSVFQRYAEQYKKILAKEGVTLTIIPSDGSIDNLKKLADPHTKVDVGFVQSGVVQGTKIDDLMSLGSVSYQPLMIFYHGESKHLISDFAGQRLNIGEEGSGTHALALTILKENGIEPGGNTKLIETVSADPVKDLLEDRTDALFVMGDSASIDLIKKLIKTPGINIYNFTQADGYTRRIKYLHKLVLPEGSLDLGKNIPVNDLNLIAPSVELIARDNLHPALSDVLLEAAREVHGSSGLFRKSGEFPTPLTQEFHISPDATRYYTSGKSFLYRNFPFWMASLINRILVILVPVALLLIPALRLAPSIYRWKIQLRIYPFYKALLELERDAFGSPVNDSKRQQIMGNLDQMEENLNKIKIPAAFGDLFYGLRGHINFVRNRLMADQISHLEESGS
jgi:TRAP-type uncharacterized transport system substrate-binding protein